MEEVVSDCQTTRLTDLSSPIIVPLSPHWYGLPTDGDYYKYAACTVVGENARFYDPSPASAYGRHGDAICTVDCLLKNKNAILQLLYFPDQTTKDFHDCSSYLIVGRGGAPSPPPVSCSTAFLEQVAFLSNITRSCPVDVFSYLQAGNWMDRVRIWDITWSPDQVTIPDNNFANDSELYMPAGPSSRGRYQGPLYSPNDGRVSAWKYAYTSNPSITGVVDIINDIMNDCTNTNNLPQQQTIIDKCRQVYSNALGSHVGPTGPINVIPSATDKIPSMYPGCQYVYDISGTPPGVGNDFGTGCPAIDEMCQNSAMKGTWRHALAVLGPEERMNKLPEHLCQNFSQLFDPAFGLAWLSLSSQPDVSDFYLAGMGMQPQKNELLGPMIEPQSSSAYVYRSCALQTFSAQPEYCCANDFADGEGGDVIFNPLATQSPPVDPHQLDAHRTPLIGYNYDSQTPWYKSCFDRGGFTCSTLFRDITGEGCGRLMLNHCAINPDTSSPDSWNPNATDGSAECSRWLGRLLYGSGGQWINFLSSVINRQTLKDTVGTKLTSSILKSITDNFHKVFTMADVKNQTLSNLATAMEPVVFSLYYSYNLNLYDDGVILNQCSIYTIDDLVGNTKLRRWCGCMLLSTSYSSRYPSVASACTPPCNSIDVIQYGTPCQGTLCVLDNITINLIDSTSNGAVSLVQVCQSCGQVYTSDTQTVKQTCDCIVDNAKITLIDSILGKITVEEMCGKAGNGGKPADVTKPPVSTRVVQSLGTVTQTFPYTTVALLIVSGVLALTAYLISREDPNKGSTGHLWGRGLAILFLMISIVLFLGVVYSVVVLTIG